MKLMTKLPTTADSNDQEFFAQITALCAGITEDFDATALANEVCDEVRAMAAAENENDPWSAIDLADTLEEYGIHKSLVALFSDDDTFANLLATTDDGEYDVAKTVTNLRNTLIDESEIEADTEVLLAAIAFFATYAALLTLAVVIEKWLNSAKRLLVKMQEHYKDVLSRPEDEVTGLMDTTVVSLTPKYLDNLHNGTRDLGKLLLDIIQKSQLDDIPVPALQSAIAKTGYVLNDESGEIKPTKNRETAFQYGKLNALGWKYKQFVEFYKQYMRNLADAIEVSSKIKDTLDKAKEQMKTAKQERSDGSLSKEEYKEKKARLKTNVRIVKNAVRFFMSMAHGAAKGMYAIASHAKYTKA